MKKVLATILALVMALSVTTMAWATDTGVSTLAELQAALTEAAKAGSGNSTIKITKDISVADGESFTSVTVDGYHGAGVVTIEGDNHTISGLTAPLYAGGFAGNSGIVIKNLTLNNVKINDSTNTQGIGAFIGSIDSMPRIELINCKLTNSEIVSTGGARLGGLIGWTSGYNNQNDGPVDTRIIINNCTVDNCKLTAKGSVGGVIGHAGCNPATYHTLSGCTVTNCTLTSTDEGNWRVGTLIGTANVGQVTIEKAAASGNTLAQAEKTAPEGENLYGRSVPNNDGIVVIDGKIDKEASAGKYTAEGSSIVKVNGIIKVDTFENAVKGAKSGDVIELMGNTEVTAQINVPAGVTINGNGYTIKANNANWSADNSAKKLMVLGSNVSVTDVVLDSNNQAGGVQAYAAANVKLHNVTMKNAAKGCGLIVNASQVAVTGKLEMSGNAWGDYINLGWGANVAGAPEKCGVNLAEATLVGVTGVYTDNNDLGNAGVTQDAFATKFEVTAPANWAATKTDDGITWGPKAPEQQPTAPRYYYNSTTTTTTDTKADTTKGSPKTFDAGVGIYAVTAVLSVTGMAWAAKKRGN